jgi:hypothetical protein
MSCQNASVSVVYLDLYAQFFFVLFQESINYFENKCSSMGNVYRMKQIHHALNPDLLQLHQHGAI